MVRSRRLLRYRPVIPDKRRPGCRTCPGDYPLRDPGSSLSQICVCTSALDSNFRRKDGFGFNPL